MSNMPKPVTDILKSRLNYAMKEKVKNQRTEFTLRNTERNLTEELSTVKSESDFMAHQVEDLRRQISELKYQIEMIEMCKASEDAKIQNNIISLNQHKDGFDQLFAKERELLRAQNHQQRQKEAEQQEAERQKREKTLEIDEQFGIEADHIEKECEEIERECGVLTKRNRAIMLQLRRRLIESETTRRGLIKQMGVETIRESNINK